MAWMPDATKMELQPESDAQPAINPTQVIYHSVAAPWTPRRMYEYWRDSTNLESHFGVGYDGSIGQFIGTQTKADANMYANRRPDGTGAVSVETASNDQHTDPWTLAQVASLVRIGYFAHRQHGIPIRVCRSHDDPGFGVHRMFPQWSNGGTACPGGVRVQQFHNLVLPGIKAAAAAGQAPQIPSIPETGETDMALTDDDIQRIAAAVHDQKDHFAYSAFWFLDKILSGEPLPEDAWAGLPTQVRNNLVSLIGRAVWEYRVPNVDDQWQQREGDAATVPAQWTAAAVNPIQFKLDQIAAALAALAAETTPPAA